VGFPDGWGIVRQIGITVITVVATHACLKQDPQVEGLPLQSTNQARTDWTEEILTTTQRRSVQRNLEKIEKKIQMCQIRAKQIGNEEFQKIENKNGSFLHCCSSLQNCKSNQITYKQDCHAP
jgi:hypothetical protein